MLRTIYSALFAALAAALFASGSATAQATPTPGRDDSAPPKPPAYQLLRQNEDWRVLKDAARSGINSIKYMPLRDDHAVWLSLGGEARLRGERWDGFRFGNPPSADADDLFLLSRLRLHGDLHIGPHVRTFVEGITAWSTDRDLVGGRRAASPDRDRGPAGLRHARGRAGEDNSASQR